MRNVHQTSAQPQGGGVDRRLARANWWLRLTSSGWNRPLYTTEQRETARRSRLASWLILGLALALLVLSPLASGDVQTLVAFSVFAVGLLVAMILNRSGHVQTTGVLLVVLIIGLIMGPMVTSPLGLTMGQLPNYDALAVAVLVAATLLPRRAIVLVALGNSAMIVADYLLRAHHANVQQDALLYPSVTMQTISLLVRPIAIEVMMAVVSYLWVRSVDVAIRRADQAEEIAGLDQDALVRKQVLEEDAHILRDAHVRLANGDYQTRVTHLRTPVLWQVGNSLNILIGRLARAPHDEAVLRRTQQQAEDLADAIRHLHNGQPVVLPLATGTPLDPIIAALEGSMPWAIGPTPGGWAPPQWRSSGPGNPLDARQPGQHTAASGGPSHWALNQDQAPTASIPQTGQAAEQLPAQERARNRQTGAPASGIAADHPAWLRQYLPPE
jgi:hypothetical protein